MYKIPPVGYPTQKCRLITSSRPYLASQFASIMATEGLDVALARLDLLESRLAAVTAEEAAGPAGGTTR